tara:strand:+ start:204 stop:338 length:135 start_codon:yes stop_codon:yes gene_type:complete
MKRLLLPLLAVLAILIALAIPAFRGVTNVECTNDTKYCLDGIRE